MPKPKSWFSIKAAAADPDLAEIYIYDEIGSYGVTAKSFISALNATKAKQINLRINSPGGACFEGNAIYNAIQRHPATVTTHIDGLAASMASVIAMAGAQVHMAKNAMIMIHNPSVYSGGDSDALRKDADMLDKVKQTLVGAYAAKTGIGEDDIAEMMDEETWMDADECLEKGFCDVITEPSEAATNTMAGFDLSRFSTRPF